MVHEWVQTSASTIGMVLFSGIAIYSAVLFYTRLAGTRAFSQISAFDFAITVAIGSSVPIILFSPEPSLGTGLVAVGALFLIQGLVAWARYGSPFVQSLVDNEPRLLMHRNHVIESTASETRISEIDLRSKLREANVRNIEEVVAVVLETTGSFSVLHGSDRDPATDAFLLKNVEGAEKLRKELVEEATGLEADPDEVLEQSHYGLKMTS